MEPLLLLTLGIKVEVVEENNWFCPAFELRSLLICFKHLIPFYSILYVKVCVHSTLSRSHTCEIGMLLLQLFLYSSLDLKRVFNHPQSSLCYTSHKHQKIVIVMISHFHNFSLPQLNKIQIRNKSGPIQKKQEKDGILLATSQFATRNKTRHLTLCSISNNSLTQIDLC